jgi:predicted HTH transcriptional regulator
MDPVSDLLARHEGKTLEFKRDLSARDSILRTIVAFANGAGGTLLVGVEDRTRRVRGVPHPTLEGERLANLVTDGIDPRVVPEIEIVPWRRAHLLLVRVFPSPLRPHHLQRLGPERGCYVRVGATNRRADAAQIAEIGRFVRGRTFDEEPRPDLDSEAIDFRAASECFEPIRKLRRSDLVTLGLRVRHQRRVVPTVGGILLFGVDRGREFPDAHVRVGAFEGTDRSRILDSAVIRDHLPLAVEAALRFVRRNTRRGLVVSGGGRHAETSEYPVVAVREAVTNAIVHADYSQTGSPLRIAVFHDRLEVENPGGLPPGLTVEDVRRGVSKLRNRVIGRVFHDLRLIEQWGSGIPRMVGACRQAGLLDPVLEELGTGFRVTIWNEQLREPDLEGLDRDILDFLSERETAATREIADHIDRTPRTTRSRLRRLEELGHIVAIGSGPRDPRRVYRRVMP